MRQRGVILTELLALLLLAALLAACYVSPKILVREQGRMKPLITSATEKHKVMGCIAPPTPPGQPISLWVKPPTCEPIETCVRQAAEAGRSCQDAVTRGQKSDRLDYAADARVCRLRIEQAVTRCERAGIEEGR